MVQRAPRRLENQWRATIAKKKTTNEWNTPDTAAALDKKISNTEYEAELYKLHAELVKLAKRNMKGKYDDEATLAHFPFVPEKF
jgi:hypothetical protein